MAYRSLFDPVVLADVRARVDRLTPNLRPRWGTLDAQRLCCHMADALRIGLGEIEVEPAAPGFMTSRLGRWMVIDSPLPWPRGIKAPEAFFSSPVEINQFERDRMRLHDVLVRFSQGGKAGVAWGVSPVFGALTAAQWARLNARHCDHHLRQFGI
jgi:hypothetical protein